jgi:hypothetical protein
MIHRTFALAAAGLLAACLSLPALADSNHRHSGKHKHSRHAAASHHHGHHYRPHDGHRHHHRHGPRYGAYVAGPSYYHYRAPRYYYRPAYVARAPGVMLYCPAYADYYPRVRFCPAWQEVFTG